MEDSNLQQHSTALLTAWEDGTLSYHDAVAQLNTLRAEAQTRARPEDEAFLESRLGVIEGYRGNYVGSIAHFERARDLYLRANNRRQVVTCTLNIGETYRLKGNFARARQYFRTGLDAAVELGDRELQVLARANESQMMISQGNAAQAEASLRECYALCEEPFPVLAGASPEVVARNQLDQRADIAHALSTLYLDSGDIEQAWHFAQEGLKLATLLQTDLRIGFAYRALGEVVTVLEHPPEPPLSPDPDHYFSESIARFKAVNAEGETARTLFAQGRSLRRRGRQTQATRKLHQAMIMFSRLGMVDDAAKAAEEQLKLL
ncbi:MAG: tetratricopeptide repeat protein [Chloroflexi bacterium]|nr:tetratricopeptide repeat protein [Chloroflexota bacterium]